MKNKRKIIIFSLLLLISLGYAVLSSNLRINGSSRIASSTWNIHFNNIVPKQGSVPIGTGDRAATITPNKDTEVTYSITLSKPGDFYEFNVDVVNSGSIDGMVNLLTSTFKEAGEEDIIINSDSSNIPSYLKYSITYSDGAPIEATHLLKSGQTETYTIRIEFKKDIQNNELPQTDQSFDIIVNGDYKQADDTAKERPPYNPCTYDGELIQGAEYVNGQYTYRYMQESLGGWQNIDIDGWGVILTDKNSLNPVVTDLCTSINSKPIVSMSNMFSWSSASSIDVSSFDTSNVVNMQNMFSEIPYVDSLDFSRWNTENVKNMSYMFLYSDASAELDLSNFDTSNVENMNHMFAYSKVTDIDLSGWDTSKVKDMSWMFDVGNSGKSFKSLDVSSFDTSKVTDMRGMFSGNTDLKELNLSNFNTSKVTSMSSMFGQLNNLEVLNLENFDFTNVSFFAYVTCEINACFDSTFSKLKILNMKNVIFPADSTGFFYGVKSSSLKIDLSNADTSNVTNLSYMFYNSNISELDLSHFDTSKVSNMQYMFGNTSNLKKINVNNWDLSNLSDASYIFYCTTALDDIDISTWKHTSNVTNMFDFFYNSGVKSINFGNFDTSNVTNMSYLFGETTRLEEIDLSKFNISNVTNTDNMFRNTAATIGYARTQADADILNSTSGKPSTLTFTVKNH